MPEPAVERRRVSRAAGGGGDSHHRLFAGADIGGTKIELVVVDAELRVVASAKCPTPQQGGPRAIVDAVVALIDSARTDAALSPVSGVGVGMPGSVSPEGTVSRSPNLRVWTATFPLAAALEERLNVRAAIDNDVRAGLRGEFRAGAAKRFSNVLGVWFGTGVGGALILDGQLRRGPRGAAGEIGHAVFRPEGRPCNCGRRGCLEAYAGRGSMERRAREKVDRGEKSELFTLMKKAGRTRLTSSVIARALDHGDKLANNLINDAVRAAGPVLASVVNVVDVEAVIIGGGLGSRLGQPFARRIDTAMQPHLLHGGSRGVKVISSELGDQSGAVGAAALVMESIAAAAR